MFRVMRVNCGVILWFWIWDGLCLCRCWNCCMVGSVNCWGRVMNFGKVLFGEIVLVECGGW